MSDESYVIAVDIGGTFTDCVVIGSGGRIGLAKARSSPGDHFVSGFFNSVEAAAAKLGSDSEKVLEQTSRVAYGSTVATNIMVQARGAKMGMLTTAGHEDTLNLTRGVGRTHGEPPENLLEYARSTKPVPLVPRDRIVGINERVDSDGDVVVALRDSEVEAAFDRLRTEGVESVACAFLWSFRNPAHELRVREIAEAVAPEIFVSLSHEVSPILGEYERFVAAAANGAVGPETAAHLTKLADELGRRNYRGALHLMQCNGGTTTIDNAKSAPLKLVGSGPVGGLIACAKAVEATGSRNLIAADMGGTSFEVGLIVDGAPLAHEETVVGKYLYRIPRLDVTSIAAGGGSIAWHDTINGVLQVGPRSAGAEPGPACYGSGGEHATVTDADLLTGYVGPNARFGSSDSGEGFPLDRQAAEVAVGRLAAELDQPVMDVARGIIEITENKMANLIENEVTGRGFDPRDFVLLAYGGAAPIHAHAFAAALGIRGIYVPGALSPLWSAYGVGSADVRHSIERSVRMVDPFDLAAIASVFDEMAEEGRERLDEQGFAGPAMELVRFMKMRYEGQLHDLNVSVPDGELSSQALAGIVASFERQYEERYGAATQLPEARPEIVALGLNAIGHVDQHQRSGAAPEQTGTLEQARLNARDVIWRRDAGPMRTEIYDGEKLPVGARIDGPLIIELSDTSVVVAEGQSVLKNEMRDFEIEIHTGGEDE